MTVAGSGRTLRGFATAVLCHLELYAQLACVEWETERARLTGLLVSLLLGVVFIFCLLFMLGCTVLLLSWDTRYRVWAMAGLLLFYGLGAVACWFRFRKLWRQANLAFADLRSEVMADIALMRRRLDP